MSYTPFPAAPQPATSGGGGGGITLTDVANAGYVTDADVAATYATTAELDAVAAGATNVTVSSTWVPADGLPAGTPVGTRVLRRKS